MPADVMDMITIESADGAGECLLSRYTDGRIPSTGPSELETLRNHVASHGIVTFDAATGPLPPGEYIAKLHSSSEGTAVDATTYFVVMEPYEVEGCGTCGATPCMPSWGEGGELEYRCGACPTGYDSSRCSGADCPECIGKDIVCRILAQPFCTLG